MAFVAILFILIGVMVLYGPVVLYNAISIAPLIGGGLVTLWGMYILFNTKSAEAGQKKNQIGPVIATIVVAVPLLFMLPKASQQNALESAKANLHQALIDRAAEICAAKVDASTELDKTAGSVHPMVVLVDKADETPAEWLPESMDKLELVACGTKDQETVETCKYSNSEMTFIIGGKVKTLKRVMEYIHFTVYDVNSGKKVSQLVVSGAIPRDCDEKETFQEDETEKVETGGVSKESITDMLKGLYSPQ